MFFRIVLLFFPMVFCWSVGFAADTGLRVESDGQLARLIRTGLDKNPQILSAQEKFKASKAAVLKAWDIKNPQFSYEFMGEDIQTRVGPQEERYGISQSIPFISKLPLRQKIAVYEEKISEHLVLHTKQAVRTQVLKAYADVLSIQRQIKILNDEEAVMRQWSDHVTSSLVAGKSRLTDASRIESNLAGVAERILKMTSLQVAAEERLRLAVGDSETVIPELDVLPLPGISQDLAELQTLALQYRHGLMIKRLSIEESNARAALSKMEYLPDLEVGFNYVQIGGGTSTRPDDGQDAWSIPVKVSIPLWEPQIRGRVEEAEHQLRSVQSDYDYMQLETRAMVSEAYTRFTTARDRMLIYESTWIPQSEEAFASSSAGYQGGSESLADVLDSFRVGLEAKLGYWQSCADVFSAYADLEQLIGFPLDQIPEKYSHEHRMHQHQ